jgi:hypothetical protein
MIPNVSILMDEITEVSHPNRTFKIVIDEDKIDQLEREDRISGYTDDLDAIKQAIYLILSTERYAYIIYSWDFGVELADLMGKPMTYAMSELPRRITEALTQDNRIDDVVDFEFERNGKKLHTTFTVVTTAGNIPTELEVEV